VVLKNQSFPVCRFDPKWMSPCNLIIPGQEQVTNLGHRLPNMWLCPKLIRHNEGSIITSSNHPSNPQQPIQQPYYWRVMAIPALQDKLRFLRFQATQLGSSKNGLRQTTAFFEWENHRDDQASKLGVPYFQTTPYVYIYIPIGSTYGIYANIWGILMVKYGKCYHI